MPALWEKIQYIADRAAPSMQQAFLRGVASTQRGVSLSALEKALKTGNIKAAWKALDWDKLLQANLSPELSKSLSGILSSAGEATIGDLLSTGVGGFGPAKPEVFDYVHKQTGDLVTKISDQTRKGINMAISQAFLEGRNPPTTKVFSILEQAANIKDSLGLNARQMQALTNYRTALKQKGLTPATYSKLQDRYRQKLLRDRASMIARTETIAAAANGQRSAWQTASGISPKEWEVEWLITPDDVTCPECRTMFNKRRSISGVYASGLGKGLKCPPLHPNCRCSERLVRKDGVQSVAPQAKSFSFTESPVDLPEGVTLSDDVNAVEMIHSTSATAAQSIMQTGIDYSKNSMYGKGVYFSDQQAYAKAEAKVYARLKPHRQLVINSDTEAPRIFSKLTGRPVASVGSEELRSDLVRSGFGSARFKVDDEVYTVVFDKGLIETSLTPFTKITGPQPIIRSSRYKEVDRELRTQLNKIRGHKERMKYLLGQGVPKQSQAYVQMERELAEMRKVKVALQQEKKILKAGGIVPPKPPPTPPPPQPPLPPVPKPMPLVPTITHKEVDRELRAHLKIIRAHKEKMRQWIRDNPIFTKKAAAYKQMEQELAELRKLKVTLQNEKRILKAGGIPPPRVSGTPAPQPTPTTPQQPKPRMLPGSYYNPVEPGKEKQWMRDFEKLRADFDPVKGTASDMAKIGEIIAKEVEARVAYESPKLMQELKEAYENANGSTYWSMGIDGRRAAEKRLHELTDRQKAMFSDNLRNVLSEIRPIGGKAKFTLTGTTDRKLLAGKKIEKLAAELERFYPTDWIATSNANRLKLCAAKEQGNVLGYYRHSDNLIAFCGPRGISKETLVHEFGHRVEATVKYAKDKAQEFFIMRTRGEMSISLGGYSCTGKPDKFFDEYCGREYFSGDTEILSRGFETLFYTPKKMTYSKTTDLDHEYINFLIGLLSVL